jgi:hypothetical protein
MELAHYPWSVLGHLVAARFNIITAHFTFPDLAYYERRQTPGLQINNPGGMILWRSMKVGLIYPIGAFCKGITLNRVTVHHVHIAVHWMAHIPLGRISCPDVRRCFNANMGCIFSWRLIISPWFATIRRPRPTLICQQQSDPIGRQNLHIVIIQPNWTCMTNDTEWIGPLIVWRHSPQHQ